jgi:hypothetical protein
MDKPTEKELYENGDKAIVEVETFLGSLGIDLALELVVTQEEELLKYTVQNHLEDYIDTSLLQKLKSWNCCFFIDGACIRQKLC